MIALQGRRPRMMWLAGALGLLTAVAAPQAAFGIFPKVVTTPVTPTVVTQVPTTPAVVTGDPVTPVTPPPSDPPPTHNTPEPATIVTGLIGLAMGGRLLRRRKVEVES